MGSIDGDIVVNNLARARVFIAEHRRRDILHAVIREKPAIAVLFLQLHDVRSRRNLISTIVGLDRRVAAVIDLGRSVILLRQLPRRIRRDLPLRDDTVRRLCDRTRDVKIAARIVQRVGHARLRTTRHVCCIVVGRCLVSADREFFLDVNRRTIDVHRRAREIVLECVQRILPIVLDLRRAVIDLCGICERQPVCNIIRRDRTLRDLALARHRVAVHAIVSRRTARMVVDVVLKRRLHTAVCDILVEDRTVRRTADVRIGVKPVDLICRRLVEVKVIRHLRESIEFQLIRRRMRCRRRSIGANNRPCAVVDLINRICTDRQRLLVDIRLAGAVALHLAIAAKGLHRADLVVRECIGITRERQLVGDVSSRCRRFTRLRICARLHRGIRAAVRPLNLQLDIVLVTVDNTRQICACHCIGKYLICLGKRVLSIILLDEMRRQLRREVTFRDRVARMVDRTVAAARELEILRIDRHIIVHAVCMCNALVIVRRTRKINILEVDIHEVAAAEIELAVLETLLDMRQILIGLPVLHILDIPRAVIHLRGIVDVKGKVICRDRTLANRALAVRRICDLIIGRIGLCRKRIREIRVLYVLAVRDDISVCIRHNVRIALEGRIRRACTIIAHDAGRIKRRTRDPIRRKRGGTASIGIARRHRGDVLRVVVRGRIIRLRHIAKSKRDLTLCDCARCTR